MKISIIGAGSSYTPEIIERLAMREGPLPVDHLTLMDIDTARLEIMRGFCARYFAAREASIRVESTTDLETAVEGSVFVVTQIRVGGNAARVLDEKIPLRYGLLGQETTGIGGFLKALRTIPAMLEIARVVERRAPGAWIVNYTNPTGIVAEAVGRTTRARIVGLCSGGLFPAQLVAKALGVDSAAVRYDYFGLNHLNFAYNFTVGGRSLSPAEMEKCLGEVPWSVDARLMRTLGMIPSPYLQYFYHARKKLAELGKATASRGQVVRKLEEEVLAELARPDLAQKPAALAKRGGGGYSDVAFAFMIAVHHGVDTWMVANVPNGGAVRMLPDDAVIETACLANASGIRPLTLGEPPEAVWGLVAAVKNYERLTVEAAVRGDREKAVLALLSHPLVGDWDVARAALEEMLEANRRHLPQFYP